MTTITEDGAGAICVLNKQDLAGLRYSLTEVLRTVEDAYKAYAAGLSANPRKLTAKPDDGRSLAYSMLGRDGERQTVAFKTYFDKDVHTNNFIGAGGNGVASAANAVVIRPGKIDRSPCGTGCSARRDLLASRPSMRSESRTEETSGLVTTIASSAKYMAR